MFSELFFDKLPIYIVWLMTAGSIFIMLQVGIQLSRLIFKQTENSGIGSMTTGIASLLAFVLAMTFSMAASKNDSRKQLVLDDANAIGTVYLRSDLLSNTLSEESKKLLREYLSLRIDNKSLHKDINQHLQASAQIQDKLWKLAISHYQITPSLGSTLYIEALNEMFDIHTTRANKALKSRIPFVIWFALALLTLFVMILTGMQIAKHEQRKILLTTVPFALAFSVILTLIVELDRPTRSVLAVGQDPLIELQHSFQESCGEC
ncbi:hypothetical protein GCM10007916_22960 [Psychromonas marina]|uniref:DUF4239 domain-containing protein n=1 Tax=Psychromonas marina TaxID=88364 RepID=A0ABQ6E1L6_9GAMM|nr:hypothetical protein [Psychromonas marina]GLS91227.1 hypothetical protein GCM10007916_22960 [Psychromonas marina]